MARRDEIIELLKKRSYTTDELAAELGVKKVHITSAMGKVREIAEISTELSIRNRKRSAEYTYIKEKQRKQRVINQKPISETCKTLYAKYAGYKLDDLPKKIWKNDLVDWYDTTGMNRQISICDLYEMAASEGIRVYKYVNDKIKWVN